MSRKLGAIHYLIQTNAAYDIKVSGQIGRRHSISVATRNDEPILKDIFQVAVDAFPEIERQKVVDHWLAVRFEQGFDYVLMWKIIGAVASVLGLVIAGFFVWNRRLAKLNRELDLAHNKIAEQNSGLEQRVAERTLELSETVNQLELTQVELVQAEKLAALGSMVAGVSHELNTPLGTAILTATMIQDRHSELKTSSDEGHLKRTQLAEFLEDAGPTDELLIRSIERSINLVQNFKQTAIDQSLALRRTFNLAIECEESLHFLRQQYKKAPWQIKLDIPPDIELDSYPGALMQITANLVINSINHGFDGRDNGCVTVKAIRDPKSETGKEYIFITVVDDGKGIAPEHLDRVFDPFFTTKLGKGGSGIGLNVVYRIATRVLGGNITVSSIFGQGTTFTLHLPQQVPDSI